MDRLVGDHYRIPVDWLMEAAGWQAARHCSGRTVVVCGKGNNGGDGLAAARHLHRWGRLQAVACVDPEAMTGPAARQVQAIQALGIRLGDDLDLEGAELVLDAVLGTGLTRAPEGSAASWIQTINDSGLDVIALDVPSGLNADTGQATSPTIRARATVTLGLPKPGLLKGDGPHHAGEVWVADIGVPFEAYSAVGLDVPPQLFSTHDRLPLADLQL